MLKNIGKPSQLHVVRNILITSKITLSNTLLPNEQTNKPNRISTTRPTQSLQLGLRLRLLGLLQPHQPLLHTTRNQCAILRVHPLHNQPPPIARPRRLHLAKNPLIGPKATRVVKVNRMVQTNHHANLIAHAVFIRHGFLAVAQGFDFRDIGFVDVAHTCELRVVHGKQLLEHVFVDRGFAGRGVAPEFVGARDGADEVAVGHVGDGAEVGFVAAVRGNGAAGFHPLATFLGVRVWGFVVFGW
jgi:hypothetical protein